MFGKPTTSLFGATGNTSFGTNTFGTPNNSAFGGGINAGAAFGTSPFGASSQPSGTTGLFGTTNQSAGGGGLFGAANTSGFGAGNTAFNFGVASGLQTSQQQQQQNANLFGATATPAYGTTTTSLFGQATQPTAGFGQTSSAMSLFGGTNTAGFMAGGLGVQQTGTTIKFVPVSDTDVMMKSGNSVNINTKMYCITGMKEYANKSFEELRHEDYLANRKSGPAISSNIVGGGFLSTPQQQQQQQQQSQASGFGMFGAQNKSAFSGFGTSTAASTSLFGAGLSQAKPLFGGGATTTTTASSGFGGITSGSMFGGNKPGGLFGATPAATTQSSLGFFGSSQPQASTAFGLGAQNTNTGGIFGQKPLGFGQTTSATSTFAFGTAQPSQSTLGGAFGAGGSLFNKPAASVATGFGLGAQNTSIGFGGFGSTPLGGSTSGFGALGTSNTTGSLFSNQQKPAGSFFGNTGTTGFGVPSLGGGLQGATNTLGTGTGFFGSNSSSLLGSQQPQLQLQQQQQNAELLMAFEQQKQIQQHITALNASPYGDNPLFKNLLGDSSRQEELLKPTNPVAQRNLLSSQTRYKQPQERTTLRTMPLSDRSEKSLLFDCLDDNNNTGFSQSLGHSTNNDETFVPRKNYKYLDVKTILQQQQTYNSAKDGPSHSRMTTPLPRSPANLGSGNSRSPIVIGQMNGEFARNGSRTRSRLEAEDLRLNGYGNDVRDALNNTMDEYTTKVPSPQQRSFNVLLDQEDRHSNNSEPTNDVMAANQRSSPRAPHPSGVVLTRPDYFTLPSLDEMAGLTNENGVCIVRDLVIGREGYGNVLFPGETNVTNLNLDELVHFRRKEIEIYPDNSNKHPIGEGLNKKAQVTLDLVYPIDKTTNQPITDYNRLSSMGFSEKLEKKCMRMGATFVEYRPETGSYVFIVEHFSKYGLLDESDDEDSVDNQTKPGTVGKAQPTTTTTTKTSTDKRQPPSTPANQTRFMTRDDDDVRRHSDDDYAAERVTKKIKGTPHPRMGYLNNNDIISMDDEDTKMKSQYSERIDDDDDDGGGDDDDYKKRYDDEQDIYDEDYMKSPTYENLSHVSAHQVQLQKASFFGGFMGEEDEEDDGVSKMTTSKMNIDKENFFKDISFSNKKSGIKPLLRNNASYTLREEGKISPFQPTANFKSASVTVTTTCASTTTVSMSFKSNHPIVPSMMTEEDLKALEGRSMVSSCVALPKVPLERSLMFNKQNLLLDLGLYQGASSRTGWSGFCGDDDEHLGWSLVHAGPAICGEDHKTMNNFLSGQQMKLTKDGESVVKMERIIPPSLLDKGRGIKDLLHSCLQAELDHCQIECCPMEVGGDDNDVGGGDCPYVSYSKNPQSLLKEVTDRLEKMNNQSEWSKNMSSAWKLCQLLWGDLGLVDDNRVEDYYAHKLRKEALTKWLAGEAEKRIAEEIKCLDNMDGQVTFALLTGFQIKEAVEVAVKTGDFHLSLLLSQAAGSDDVRVMLRKQLELWSDNKSDQFITESRLATYALLGGVLWLRTSRGTINCCKSLDWKRCFGLHLWYACSANCSIGDALREYELSYEGESTHGKYSVAPNPSYIERWGLDDEVGGVKDVTFHLLKLFCNDSYPLKTILNPAAFSENDMDYSCSFHLMKLLGSLGFQHLSTFHLSSICHNYASQLEAVGQWHWSAFVLMHIPHPISRNDAVKKLISRNVELIRQNDEEDDDDDVMVDDDDDVMTMLSDKERFIVEKLKIPVEWVHEAKAIRANSEGDHELRSTHLFWARQYALYHDLVVTKLAPSAITNGDHRSIMKWFVCLERTASWNAVRFEDGGGVYLRYLRMLEILGYINRLEEEAIIKEGELSETEETQRLLEEMEALLDSLMSGIKRLPSETPVDRYAQHLMSESLLRASVKLVSNHQGTYKVNEDYVVRLRSSISDLPMSQELLNETDSKLLHEHLKNTIIRSIRLSC